MSSEPASPSAPARPRRMAKRPTPAVESTKDWHVTADTARTEQFVVAISPRALRMLAAVAKHRDMSCEALAREYLSDGIRKDRMEQFYVTASMTMREVLQELAPESAAELIAEFSRRLREQAGNP